MDTRLEHYL